VHSAQHIMESSMRNVHSQYAGVGHAEKCS